MAARKKQTTFSVDDVAAFRTLDEAIVNDGKQLNAEAVKTSSEGKAVVRCANELIESEVEFGRLALTKLTDHS